MSREGVLIWSNGVLLNIPAAAREISVCQYDESQDPAELLEPSEVAVRSVSLARTDSARTMDKIVEELTEIAIKSGRRSV